MLEEFFHDPAILRSFAKHYQTNEPLTAGSDRSHEPR